MNHETKVNNQRVYNCTFCGNEIVVPIDESARAKPEHVDECPECGHSNVIHIKTEGSGYVQVWVKGHSHDEQKSLAIQIRR
jgi:DNA-directed RNA polymerase subunit RPC12/RpoP